LSFLNELKRRNVLRVGAAYIVSSWLLIQVAETIFPLFGYGDTPARLVVIVLAIAFIPSLIFAWVFEITPEGLKRDADVVREHSIAHVTGKKLDRIILVVLACALAYFAFDKFVLDPARDQSKIETARQEGRTEAFVESYGDKSIAVLPFVNMSDDAGNEYFSDGISEELLNLLSKIPEMRVISRSSAFSFKGKKIDIPTIATQLNVAYILEGSVRKAGNQIRITAQLIEARSDTHLWSETYDRELVNIFKVQDDISAAIIGALKERLGLESEAVFLEIAAVNIEAHDAYLRGRHLIIQRTRATAEGAVKELEKAIVLDPDYALAHAELAMATLLSGRYADLTDPEAITKATPHVERSLVLDPNLAEAHAARGLTFSMQGELEEALTQYERALQINPNYSTVHLWMGQLLADLGRYEEANAMMESALRLDPVSMVAIINYVVSLTRQNRLDGAERELEKLASIAPAWYARNRGFLTSVGGKWANEALGILDGLKILPEARLFRFWLPWSLAVLGLEEEVLAVSDNPFPNSLLYLGKPGDAVTGAEAHLSENPTSMYVRRNLGLALAAVGDYIRARPLLEEMWRQSGGRVTHEGLFRLHEAAALTAIRRDAGGEIGVGELLVAIRDNVRRYHEADFTGNLMTLNADFDEGLAAFLAGEREKGLALIAKAAEEGYFILPKVAYLKTLYDDPGFAPILANQVVRQARERKRFLDIVCNDNPYVDVWQPAEGTCEQFAMEGGN